jgi:hypothetical protein
VTFFYSSLVFFLFHGAVVLANVQLDKEQLLLKISSSIEFKLYDFDIYADDTTPYSFSHIFKIGAFGKLVAR